MDDHSTKKAQIIQLNESAVRDHLGEMVRNTVEDTLNSMLDSEADRLCNAEKALNLSRLSAFLLCGAAHDVIGFAATSSIDLFENSEG